MPMSNSTLHLHLKYYVRFVVFLIEGYRGSDAGSMVYSHEKVMGMFRRRKDYTDYVLSILKRD